MSEEMSAKFYALQKGLLGDMEVKKAEKHNVFFHVKVRKEKNENFFLVLNFFWMISEFRMIRIFFAVPRDSYYRDSTV